MRHMRKNYDITIVKLFCGFWCFRVLVAFILNFLILFNIMVYAMQYQSLFKGIRYYKLHYK